LGRGPFLGDCFTVEFGFSRGLKVRWVFKGRGGFQRGGKLGITFSGKV